MKVRNCKHVVYLHGDAIPPYKINICTLGCAVAEETSDIDVVSSYWDSQEIKVAYLASQIL
jgi:hypothetical protein